MRFQVSNNASGTTWAENKTVGAILVNVKSTGAGFAYDPKAVNVVVSLSRQNRNQTIAAANLYSLAKGDDPSTAEGQSLTADSITWQGYYISLGKVPLNLRGNDRLTVNVSVAGATDAVTTVSILPCVGTEFYTPRIDVYPVNKNKTTMDVPLGTNVTKVALIQSGNAWSVTAFSLQTALLSYQAIQEDILALVAAQRQGNTTATDILDRTSCIIYNGEPTNDGELNLTVDTAETADAYVVVFSGDSRDVAGMGDAVATSEKIKQRVRQKFGTDIYATENTYK